MIPVILPEQWHHSDNVHATSCCRRILVGQIIRTRVMITTSMLPKHHESSGTSKCISLSTGTCSRYCLGYLCCNAAGKEYLAGSNVAGEARWENKELARTTTQAVHHRKHGNLPRTRALSRNSNNKCAGTSLKHILIKYDKMF